MMPIGQFGVDGCHLDGGRAQYGLGDHQGGRQGGGTGVARNVGAGVLFYNKKYPPVQDFLHSTLQQPSAFLEKVRTSGRSKR